MLAGIGNSPDLTSQIDEESVILLASDRKVALESRLKLNEAVAILERTPATLSALLAACPIPGQVQPKARVPGHRMM